MAAAAAWLALLLIVSVITTAISCNVFMVQYRYRRGATRWLGIPVPMSRSMWAAALLLGGSELGAVVSVVLLVLIGLRGH